MSSFAVIENITFRDHYMEERKQKVIDLAKQFSFEVLWRKDDVHLIRFERDYTKIDVWCSSMTVGIYENRTQKFLKKVSMEDLAELFANPNATI